MPRKAELAADQARCTEFGRRAVEAYRQGRYQEAVSVAASAVPHLGGALSYQRRHSKPARITLPPAAVILRLAPPLFARRPLDALAAWTAALGRADRKAMPDLPAAITAARNQLAVAVRGWAALGSGVQARPAPAAVVKVWLAAGLVERVAAGVRRATTPDRPTVGKCPGCGRGYVTSLSELLAPALCTGCGNRHQFALVARAEVS